MRAVKRRMMRKELKSMVKGMGISMKTMKKWFRLRLDNGKHISLMKKLEVLDELQGKNKSLKEQEVSPSV
jgi:hypothetical protein